MEEQDGAARRALTLLGTQEHVLQVFRRFDLSPKQVEAISGGFLFALRHLLRRPFEPHTNATLAHAAGMYADAFRKEFVRLFGATPEQYLTQERLGYARHKLLSTHQSVHTIAVKAGFPNASAFSRAYAAHFGCTPTQQRQNSKPGGARAGRPEGPAAASDAPHES